MLPMTCFEDLSNDLLYEIFDYLTTLEMLDMFGGLNQRFNNLLLCSDLPWKIDFTEISKTKLVEYCRETLVKSTGRVISLRLPHPTASDTCLSRLSLDTFVRLKFLDVSVLNSEQCQSLLDRLIPLPSLLSLSIDIFQVNTPIQLYDQIFRLLTLNHVKVSSSTITESAYHDLTATQRISFIEHLELLHRCSLEQLAKLLSCLPDLRSLTGCPIYSSSKEQSLTISTMCTPLLELKYLSLDVRALHFDLFVDLMVQIGQSVQELSLTVHHDLTYLDAQRRQSLISTSMPNLVVFDFQNKCFYYGDAENTHKEFHQLTSGFGSPFWIEKNWQFAHQCCPRSSGVIYHFFSISANRRQQLYFHGQSSNTLCVHYHDRIETVATSTWGHDQWKQFIHEGTTHPHVKKIIIGENIGSLLEKQVLVQISCMIPFTQLTTIVVQKQSIGLSSLIDLLLMTPHLQDLTIPAVTFKDIADRSRVALHREKLKVLSKKCPLRQLTISATCTIELIRIILKHLRQLYALHCQIEAMTDLGQILGHLVITYQEHRCRLLSFNHPKIDRNLIHRIEKCLRMRSELTNYSATVQANTLHIWF